MRLIKVMAGSLIAAFFLAAPAFAADKAMKVDMDQFMKACDMNHDGMMSKEEMLRHMEKMFDKMDRKKTGKLDKQQAEEFLKQLTLSGG